MPQNNKSYGDLGKTFRPEKDDRQALLSTSSGPSRASRSWLKAFVITALAVAGTLGTLSLAWHQYQTDTIHVDHLSAKKLDCSWKSLKNHVTLLDVAPIRRDEFLSRQATLAAALDAAGVDAFIAEPSASTSYYANISTSYELSERPFLVVIDKTGQFSYLGPKFELNRIAGLEMVYKEKKVIQWREEDLWYEVLKKETGYKKVMLDEHARYMIASGLEKTGIEVVPTSREIQVCYICLLLDIGAPEQSLAQHIFRLRDTRFQLTIS